MKKSILMKTLILFSVIGFFLIPINSKAQIRPKKITKPILLRMPDLEVSIKCPHQAYPGQELRKSIKVTVKNKGTATAKNFSVDLVLSSDTIIPVKYAIYSPNFHEDVLLKGGREYVKSLAPGAKINLILYGTNKIPSDTPPGNYYLGVVVDSGNKVKELRENNNTAICRMSIAPFPDLVVTGFGHTGSPSGLPPECRLLVEIRNIGQGAVPTGTAARLNVYVNDVLVDSVDLDSSKVEQTAYHDFHNPYDPANPGKSRSIVSTDYIFPPSTTSANYTVRAVIDPTNKIRETNEGNNSFERVEQIPAH